MDYVTPQKNRVFEEYDENPTNISLYVILIKQTEFRLVSDGNKSEGVEVIEMILLELKSFMEKNII